MGRLTPTWLAVCYVILGRVTVNSRCRLYLSWLGWKYSGKQDLVMSANWDDYADEWDSNPDVIKYAESAFESLAAYQNLDDLTVLDFGCGTGQLTAKIAALARSVLAMDASPK